jgi:hypothetical protein
MVEMLKTQEQLSVNVLSNEANDDARMYRPDSAAWMPPCASPMCRIYTGSMDGPRKRRFDGLADRSENHAFRFDRDTRDMGERGCLFEDT